MACRHNQVFLSCKGCMACALQAGSAQALGMLHEALQAHGEKILGYLEADDILVCNLSSMMAGKPPQVRAS